MTTMTISEATVEIARPAAIATRRLESIDLLRGLVMVIMALDHVRDYFHANAFVADPTDLSQTSTLLFLTRWITHLCAPTFVFLAGTALALSVERRVAKGVAAWSIDKDVLIRGGIIALMDPTIISLGSGRLTFQVLLAIGLAMMCMAPLRRLPTWALLSLGIGWFAFGEIVTLQHTRDSVFRRKPNQAD